MGRRRKMEASYFMHYINDPVADNLRKDWGNDGYAFWYSLLELLCGSSGHYISIAEKGGAYMLAEAAAVSPDAVKKMLKRLVELGAIDQELYEKKQIIWCPQLIDSVKHVYSKRKTELPQKPTAEIEEDTVKEMRGGRKDSGNAAEQKFESTPGNMCDSIRSAEAWFKDEKPAAGNKDL